MTSDSRWGSTPDLEYQGFFEQSRENSRSEDLSKNSSMNPYPSPQLSRTSGEIRSVGMFSSSTTAIPVSDSLLTSPAQTRSPNYSSRQTTPSPEAAGDLPVEDTRA